jgi:HEAT repeat protein
MSRDYATRLIAVEALGTVDRVDTTPWLAHALGDPEHDVRVAAVQALSHLRFPRAERLLRSVRDDVEEALDIRALAASALLGRPAHAPR